MATTAEVRAGRAYVSIEAIDKTGKILNSVSKKMNNFGKSMMSIGTALGAGVALTTVPLVNAVKSAASFEEKWLELRSVLGKSDKELSSLNKKVRELGKSTFYTAEEVANAASELSRGGLNADQVEKSLQPVLTLARTGNMGMQEAALTIVRSMSAFDIPAEHAQEIADKLFYASTKGTTNVQMLAQALAYTSGSASGLNMSLGKTLAVLTKLADGMLYGTRGGTSLNNMLTRMATEGDKIKDYLGFDIADKFGNMRPMEEIFFNLVNAMDKLSEFERANILNDIFNIRGKRAGDVIYKNLREILKLMRELDGEASKGAAMKATVLRSSSILEAIKRIVSAITDLAIAIGFDLKSSITSFSDYVIPIVNRMTGFVEANKGIFQTFSKILIAVGGVAAGVFAIGAAAFAAKVAIAALAGMFTAITSIPGMIAVGITAAFGQLIAGLVAFTALVKAMWDKVGDEAVAAWNKAKDAWEHFSKVIKHSFELIKSSLEDVWIQLKQILGDPLEGFLKLLGEAAEATGNLAEAIIELSTTEFVALLKIINTILSPFAKLIQMFDKTASKAKATGIIFRSLAVAGVAVGSAMNPVYGLFASKNLQMVKEKRKEKELEKPFKGFATSDEEFFKKAWSHDALTKEELRLEKVLEGASNKKYLATGGGVGAMDRFITKMKDRLDLVKEMRREAAKAEGIGTSITPGAYGSRKTSTTIPKERIEAFRKAYQERRREDEDIRLRRAKDNLSHQQAMEQRKQNLRSYFDLAHQLNNAETKAEINSIREQLQEKRKELDMAARMEALNHKEKMVQEKDEFEQRKKDIVELEKLAKAIGARYTLPGIGPGRSKKPTTAVSGREIMRIKAESALSNKLAQLERMSSSQVTMPGALEYGSKEAATKAEENKRTQKMILHLKKIKDEIAAFRAEARKKAGVVGI